MSEAPSPQPKINSTNPLHTHDLLSVTRSNGSAVTMETTDPARNPEKVKEPCPRTSRDDQSRPAGDNPAADELVNGDNSVQTQTYSQSGVFNPGLTVERSDPHQSVTPQHQPPFDEVKVPLLEGEGHASSQKTSSGCQKRNGLKLTVDCVSVNTSATDTSAVGRCQETSPQPNHVSSSPEILHNQTSTPPTDSPKPKIPRWKSIVRDRNMMANVKTAVMLFIVTLVFAISFLPSLLMANDIIPKNLIVFYGYHLYNVANPFIYAFMNQRFRDDFKNMFKGCCCPVTY